MGKIEITKKVLGICATNCYTVVDTETKEALIIDPADRADVLIRDWKDKGVTPTAVLLTHGHFDHIGALAGVKKEYPEIRVYAAAEEKEVIWRSIYGAGGYLSGGWRRDRGTWTEM